jgi:hypothetical protein
MKGYMIDKIRKVSLRYGFYSHLLRIKNIIDGVGRRINEIKKEGVAVEESSSKNKVLTESPRWKSVAVRAGARVVVKAAVEYLPDEKNRAKALLLVKCYNEKGEEVEEDFDGLFYSNNLRSKFKYLYPTDGKKTTLYDFKVPFFVSKIKIGFVKFNSSEEEIVKLNEVEVLIESNDAPFIHDPARRRYTSDLVIACILDEFTSECLRHEASLVKITQEAWESQLEAHTPDLLLVESCWRGNDNNWGALTKGSGGGKKLCNLLRYCKENDIPTVFWNKEDPPHYEKFGSIATLFDLVFTTDINMVPRYKDDFGIEVYPLSFGAQPKIHNPSPVIPRLEKAVFAGSYYCDKPKRCADFNEVMGQLEQAGVQYDIFDRNYQKGIEKFSFPERYQVNIVGNLSAEEVWKAHKGYKYQINMNSVQNSSTMFARRVYESLASGTPVISNDSVGVRELFGDVVIMSRAGISIAEQLRELEASPASYQELSRRGVRAVMREHTYGHRIQTLCRFLGIDVEISLPKAVLAFTASSEEDVKRAKQLFAMQTAPSKHLFIELENFDTAYKFLSESSDTITFAMHLAREFYNDENKYYSSDIVLRCNVNDDLPATALEDFMYWGEL